MVEKLSASRYRLRDLENNHVFDEFDVSNLRPYHEDISSPDLQDDEYLVRT